MAPDLPGPGAARPDADKGAVAFACNMSRDMLGACAPVAQADLHMHRHSDLNSHNVPKRALRFCAASLKEP